MSWPCSATHLCIISNFPEYNEKKDSVEFSVCHRLSWLCDCVCHRLSWLCLSQVIGIVWLCLSQVIVIAMMRLLGCAFFSEIQYVSLLTVKNEWRIHRSESTSGYQRLYDGVVGSIHVGVEGERALSIAVVGCVAFRSDDPILRQDGNYALEVSKWIVQVTSVYILQFETYVAILILLLKFTLGVIKLPVCVLYPVRCQCRKCLAESTDILHNLSLGKHLYTPLYKKSKLKPCFDYIYLSILLLH